MFDMRNSELASCTPREQPFRNEGILAVERRRLWRWHVERAHETIDFSRGRAGDAMSPLHRVPYESPVMRAQPTQN